MSKAWEKAKKGAKWLGGAGLIVGGVLGAVGGGLMFGPFGALGGMIGGALQWGLSGAIVGGAVGGVVGAVTDDKETITSQPERSVSIEKTQERTTSVSVPTPEPEMSAERKFQEKVEQSRVTKQTNERVA